jgi:hypothetical protein
MPLPGDEALSTLTIITISYLKQIIYFIVKITYLVFKTYIIKLKYNVWDSAKYHSPELDNLTTTLTSDLKQKKRKWYYKHNFSYFTN